MIQAKNKKFWLFWILGSAVLVGWLGFTLLWGNDKSVFMPGDLTGGHHQMGIACETCHTNDFTTKEDFQEACESCHGDLRKKPFDSHPKAKFKDPRNAELLEKVDVLYCISCHREHQPEITQKGGVTQPADFCVHCHAEVGENRPSHKGMDFMTCSNSGCHNFHNNRALYTDFLVKHLHEPDVLEKTKLPQRDFGQRLAELADYPHDLFPQKALEIADSDAPETATLHADINTDWLASSHAQAGVNCTACHNVVPEGATEAQWTDKPDHQACASCHGLEVEHFQQGKHGMRLKVGLSPMTPAMARQPMAKGSEHQELTCITCHSAHQFDVKQASVEACLGCHVDEHSLAYKDSPHFELWQQELSGALAEGSGVSCASCHMPRVDMDVNDWMSRIVVMHNQNATLYPREKMLRPACLNCHGLEFSINAISDNELVKTNFNGQPTFKTESMRLAEEDEKRHREK